MNKIQIKKKTLKRKAGVVCLHIDGLRETLFCKLLICCEFPFQAYLFFFPVWARKTNKNIFKLTCCYFYYMVTGSQVSRNKINKQWGGLGSGP